ncbi:hypothetical protein Tco_0121055 [Tanacetum coccineum]
MGYSTRELPARAYGDGPVQEPEHPKYHAPSDDDIQIRWRRILMRIYLIIQMSSSDMMRMQSPPTEEEEEEHLAPADSSVVLVVDPVPSTGDTEAFETDESAPTPRSP